MNHILPAPGSATVYGAQLLVRLRCDRYAHTNPGRQGTSKQTPPACPHPVTVTILALLSLGPWRPHSRAAERVSDGPRKGQSSCPSRGTDRGLRAPLSELGTPVWGAGAGLQSLAEQGRQAAEVTNADSVLGRAREPEWHSLSPRKPAGQMGGAEAFPRAE